MVNHYRIIKHIVVSFSTCVAELAPVAIAGIAFSCVIVVLTTVAAIAYRYRLSIIQCTAPFYAIIIQRHHIVIR